MGYSLNFSPYVLPEYKDRLLKYQYHGEDRSHIYRLFWRPLCGWAVHKLPMWLAPNVITVLGLVGVVLTHLAFIYYMPSMTLDDALGSPPTILFILSAVALFVYQFLDNLDGHQARRTHSSSPLGLLMDHGCDALNCCIGSISVASCVCVGPTWKAWIAMISAVTVFFGNTWEEYYRGSLILPVINGPNEGILVAICIYLWTAVVTPAWWLQSLVVPLRFLPQGIAEWLRAATTSGAGQLLSGVALGGNSDQESTATIAAIVTRFFAPISDMIRASVITEADGGNGSLHVQYNTIAIGFMLVCGVFTLAGNVYQVYVAVSRSPTGSGKYGSSWLLRTFPFLHALTRLIPLLVITVLANIWFAYSPNLIFEKHPRIFCWTVGLLYTKLAIHLMIAHLCSVEFHPLRRTFIPFLYFGGHIAVMLYLRSAAANSGGSLSMEKGTLLAPQVFGWLGISTSDEITVLLEFFALSLVTMTHLAVNALNEMATILDVDVFSNARQRARWAAAEAAAATAKSK